MRGSDGDVEVMFRRVLGKEMRSKVDFVRREEQREVESMNGEFNGIRSIAASSSPIHLDRIWIERHDWPSLN